MEAGRCVRPAEEPRNGNVECFWSPCVHERLRTRHRWQTTRRTKITKQLRTQLRQLIHYAKGADTSLQRVAEKLANEAVKPERQVQIVDLGGLELLPLVASTDHEVQRLAAHALANLSVNTDNQVRMAMRVA